MRTIDDMSSYLGPTDEMISNSFYQNFFGSETPFSELRNLFSLKTSDGGLGLPILQDEAGYQFRSSVKIISQHFSVLSRQ